MSLFLLCLLWFWDCDWPFLFLSFWSVLLLLYFYTLAFSINLTSIEFNATNAMFSWYSWGTSFFDSYTASFTSLILANLISQIGVIAYGVPNSNYDNLPSLTNAYTPRLRISGSITSFTVNGNSFGTWYRLLFSLKNLTFS